MNCNLWLTPCILTIFLPFSTECAIVIDDLDGWFMQKQACGIVGGFMEDLFGKELKPWQESERLATEP